MWQSFAVPLQLVCQLVVPGNFESGNTTIAVGELLPNQTTALPDGFTEFPEVGMAYRYFNSVATWNNARKTCVEYDSNLAVVDSLKKFNIIYGMRGDLSQRVFVGIHKLFGDGEWLSVKTGLPVSSIPWAPNTNNKDVSKNCASMWNDGRGLGTIECTSLRYFACEIPLRTA